MRPEVKMRDILSRGKCEEFEVIVDTALFSHAKKKVKGLWTAVQLAFAVDS
jgi:hypothetical protein